MSTHFMIACPMCRAEGPQIRRSAGGVGLMASTEWENFLIEHEWHGPLLMVHELADVGSTLDAYRGETDD